MSLPKVVEHISVEEYLEVEQFSEVKHEYLAGHVFAMVGASEEHNLIAGNVYRKLRDRLAGGHCRAFMSDMKARIEAVDTFYYPDVLVTCERDDQHRYYKTRPCLIVEVLSSETEIIDRREKRLNYFRLDSLREYVLIPQRERRVEVYRRDGADRWQYEGLGPDDVLRLKSLPVGTLRMTMDKIYQDVGFNRE
jgi:Uma2 family endonuclease